MRNLEEALFWEVLYRPEAIRSELARSFHVSSATISRSVAVLRSKRLLIEADVKIPHCGRRPALLRVNPELAHVAGIEIDRDRITAVVTDLSGKLLGRGASAGSAQSSVQSTLQGCRKALRIALADARLRTRIARIGVGHTATLDVENGVCLDWEGVPHWRGVKLLQALRNTFESDVTLDDRARALALALHLLIPENRRHRSAIYVQIGSGVGAGIFVEGRMIRGATLAGGELGHIVIDRNGPLCACGRKGCVEAYASLRATIARIAHAMDTGAPTSLRSFVKSSAALTPEIVVAAARHGDALAKDAIAVAGEALGLGIANSVQLLNPSLVVLAGKFANAAKDLLLDGVTKTIRAHCFETMSRTLEIRIAPVRKDVGPVGCALLAALDLAPDLLQAGLFAPAA